MQKKYERRFTTQAGASGNAPTGAAAGAHGAAATDAAVEADLSVEEQATDALIVKCDVTNIFDTDNIFHQHPGETEVSVGIFVINVEHERTRQQTAAAKNEAGVFYMDFLISVSKPEGSTLWAGDTEMWNTLKFRNAKSVHMSADLPGMTGVRHVQGSFYYDPDLRMYPLDSQNLQIIIEQTTHTADKWVFRPSKDLNGMSKTIPDIRHQVCSGDEVTTKRGGKEYSTFVYTVTVRNPRWFSIITGFLPPLLTILPIVFSYTLGPLSWYPLRILLNIGSLLSLTFFYDSFLRRLPMLMYLTAFDKYIYCLYIWCILRWKFS